MDNKKDKTITYEEAIKDMTPEELERFHKERYEKFINPLMEMNIKELENLGKRKKHRNDN